MGVIPKNVEPFILGGLSGCNAEFFTFPVDLVKTRLQIQGQVVGNVSIRYKGTLDCMRLVWKEEGLVALYSG